MTLIPELKNTSDAFNTENLRQCKNCGHWIYYCSEDFPLMKKGWYHHNRLYKSNITHKVLFKNFKRCWAENCKCTNPEPDPNGKTWNEVHKDIIVRKRVKK